MIFDVHVLGTVVFIVVLGHKNSSHVVLERRCWLDLLKVMGLQQVGSVHHLLHISALSYILCLGARESHVLLHLAEPVDGYPCQGGTRTWW